MAVSDPAQDEHEATNRVESNSNQIGLPYQKFKHLYW